MPNRNTQILVVASAFLLLFAVVSADVQLADTRFSVLLFYLVPIAWCAWFGGRNIALFIAIFCIFARFGVEIIEEINSGTQRGELMWSIASELLFFLVFGALLWQAQQQLERERSLARLDALTGLCNARAFKAAVAAERERLRRYGRICSLVYLDLDDFKSVNDRLGHATGDALLKVIGDTLRDHVRQVDVAARLGGDEFALLLPETEPNGAATVVLRLHGKILNAMDANKWPVTCSLGCITFCSLPDSVDIMLEAADATMYRAKKSGKNRIESTVWNENLELKN